MSEGVADLLEHLHAEGDFPYYFEIRPSQGELEGLEAKVRGKFERPVVAFAAYVTPPNPERLAAITAQFRRETP